MPFCRLPLLALAALASAVSGVAQVAVTAPDFSYGQNFDRAEGWTSGNVAWENNVTFPGWHAALYDSDSGELTTPPRVFVTNGPPNDLSAFLIYRSAATPHEGALGAQGVDRHMPGVLGGGIFYGVHFVNRSGRTLDRVSLAYRVELWRGTTQNPQLTLTAAYLKGGETLTDEDEWTLITGAAYTTPRGRFPSATSLDGNLPENVVTFDVAIPDLALAPGQSLWIRWFDVNNRSTDHGIALDDFTATFTPR